VSYKNETKVLVELQSKLQAYSRKRKLVTYLLLILYKGGTKQCDGSQNLPRTAVRSQFKGNLRRLKLVLL